MARNKSVADQLNGYTAQDVKDKSKDLAKTTIATVQDLSNRAMDVAQSTATSVQQNVQSSLDTAQGLLLRNKKQANKNLKKAQKNMRSTQKNMGESAQSGLNNPQELLQLALGVAAVLLEANKQRASKNIKQARKNLNQLQGVVQDNVQSGLGVAQDVLGKSQGVAQDVLGKGQDVLGKSQGVAQDVLGKGQDALDRGTKSASKNLKKVGANVKDLQDNVGDRLQSYQRKRARNRFLFRLGLVAGVAAALLYAPQTGAQTRQRLGAFGQGLAQRSQQLLDRFLS